MAACQPLVNSAIAFTNTLPRNTFRQPGTYYQNTAVLKNFGLTREAMKLQFRAEFFNVFNHPNLYINAGTNNVFAPLFHRGGSQTVPGVTASLRDNRQIVLALKLIF